MRSQTVTTNSGSTANFTIPNSVAKYMYSLVDINNLTYGTSLFGTNRHLTFISDAFTNSGTYNLRIAADNLAAPDCRTFTDVSVVVNAQTLALYFRSVAVKSGSVGSRLLNWSVAGEEGVVFYEVERSNDCINFAVIGKVALQTTNEN